MKNKKIAIYGPYPPPLGGISVHIKRIEYFLKEAKLPYTIFNFGYTKRENVIPTNKSLFWYLKILFNRKFDLFHFHQFFLFEFIFYFIFSKLNRTPALVTIHGEDLFKVNKFLRGIFLFFLKKSNFKVISVSKNLNDLLVEKKIDSTFISAYVPPMDSELLPVEKDGRIYFLFSVWKLTKKLSEEIYNVQLAFEFLAKNRERFKMLFFIGNEEISDTKYLNSLIDDFDVKRDVDVFFGKNLVNYIQNCSFLLKTNFVDGYGVALQEAMDLGVPAIASDVCVRPNGTIIFKDNDLDDLQEKVQYCLNTPTKEILAKKDDLIDHLEIIDIYKSMLCKNS